jgi:cell division protein FtsN
MENKNLNDIIIEDAETSKGNQLKNILTLLALLFIILVISIVITKLILGGDDNDETSHLRADGTVQEIGENNLTGMASNELASANNGTGNSVAVAGAALVGAAATVALTSKNSDDKDTTSSSALTATDNKMPLLAERNTTSRTKVPLRTEESTKGNTKSASRQSDTPKKTVSTSGHSKGHSTYTRPKYVKKRTTTTTRTRTKHVATKKITRGYYIKVGTFANPSTAIRNIKAIKLNYKTTKIKSGLTRVLIGPFYSQRDAQNHLAKAKANVASDAYISKIK